eukprot:489000-Prymnesium_polylepis.1
MALGRAAAARLHRAAVPRHAFAHAVARALPPAVVGLGPQLGARQRHVRAPRLRQPVRPHAGILCQSPPASSG